MVGNDLPGGGPEQALDALEPEVQEVGPLNLPVVKPKGAPDLPEPDGNNGPF